jgi:omega-amidase
MFFILYLYLLTAYFSKNKRSIHRVNISIFMIVHALEYNISWKNPAENFKIILDLTQDIKADILVLPEMFNTGFCIKAPEIAEDKQGLSFQFLVNLSKEKQLAVIASMAFIEDGLYYNRLFFIKPDGSYQYYNKRHLFSFAGEDALFTKGQKPCIVHYKNWRIKLQVCYDLRFPVFSRNLQNYDLLIYVANWPQNRQLAWDSLLPARAIENQAFVLGVNRCGTDANGLSYQGNSQLISFDGKILAKTENNMLHTSLNLKVLQEFRNNFPFLNDADTFNIEI